MWVDGKDSIFQRQYNNYAGAASKKKLAHEGTGRHRDNGELKYCLRGIDHNAPWINRIHIVTSGQVPYDLDFDHPKLNLVIHSDIFPDLNVLPTFNSFAIDSCLHNIPGLSEKFVRLSDDFLILNPISTVDLMGDSGAGRYYFGPVVRQPDELARDSTHYMRTLSFNRSILQKEALDGHRNPLHVPQVRDIGTCRSLEKRFEEHFARTRAHRFRSDQCLSMLYLYPHYVAAERDIAIGDNGDYHHGDFINQTWGKARQALVGDSRKDWRKTIGDAVVDKVYFLNVNDHLGENPDPSEATDYRRMLEGLFPIPASFEQQTQPDHSAG